MPLRLPLLHRPALTGTGRESVLNLPGTRIGPGRRERSSRRGRESPRSRERRPGPRGAALPPPAKGSASWGWTIRGRIDLETALCFLSLLQRLCSAARAGRGVLGHSSQTSDGTGESPQDIPSPGKRHSAGRPAGNTCALLRVSVPAVDFLQAPASVAPFLLSFCPARLSAKPGSGQCQRGEYTTSIPSGSAAVPVPEPAERDLSKRCPGGEGKGATGRGMKGVGRVMKKYETCFSA